MDIYSDQQNFEGEQMPTAGDNLERYGQIDFPEGLKSEEDNPRGNIWYLPIIGHIEGHMLMPPGHKTTKYEHIIPMLLHAAENPKVDGLLVVLNTVGGDVEAGLAIAELIKHFTKPTVSLVLGGGHSIGVPLAVAAEYSYIAPSAAMTIHPVRMNGTMVGAPQTYDYFNKMQDRVLDFVTSNSKIKNKRLRELMMDTASLAMDMGTFLIGEEAVKEGLIDEVGGLFSAMERLYGMIEEIRAE
ncbi:MAG: ATP-dependent Clp protease proteolytic subunit [Clostridiales bacterium]|jgi:ATP-dependent protease ClpP protease subunit|nr:ATP-dependent Clp protease proteolytic subunit [Clostridiales bacterium]